jgi:hypothetical protein
MRSILLYLDGFDLRRVALEQRKQLLQDRIMKRRGHSFFRSLCGEGSRIVRGGEAARPGRDRRQEAQ